MKNKDRFEENTEIDFSGKFYYQKSFKLNENHEMTFSTFLRFFTR